MTTTPVTTKPSSFASRLRSYGVVYATLTTQSPEATTVLSARKAAMLAADAPADEPVLDASEDTTYRELFDHLARELEMAKTEMLSANSTHLGQLAQIVDLKTRRDSLNGNLSGRFFKARHTFEALYGSDRRFAVLAISGDTPTDPTGLIAQVRETVGFLEAARAPLQAFAAESSGLLRSIKGGGRRHRGGALSRSNAAGGSACPRHRHPTTAAAPSLLPCPYGRRPHPPLRRSAVDRPP